MKFPIEPLSAKQPEEHAQPKLETHRPIRAEISESALQSVSNTNYGPWAIVDYHVGLVEVNAGEAGSDDAMLKT